MTKVEITIAEPRFSIIFDGHAEGSPEVCTAVSTLMFSLEGYLRNHEEELFLHSAKMDSPGWGYLMFELEDPAKDIRGAFDLVMIGLLSIANDCPEYCEVTVKEIKK